MSKINALREQRTALAKECRDLLDKFPAKAWTAEHTKTYDAKVEEIAGIDASIARFQKQADIDAENAIDLAISDVIKAAGNVDPNSPMGVYRDYFRKGLEGLTAEQAKSFRNTLSTTTGSQGGFSVPTLVVSQLIDAMKLYGGMRAVSEQFTTDGGEDMNYPTSDGTSEVGELITQNTTANAQDPTFGVVTLSTYKFSSKVVAVPFELLQDSVLDIEAMVNKRLGQRLGRIQNTYFTTGTGTAQPNGVVTAATSGKVGITGQTLTIIYDDLVDLIASVDPAYRNLGNCRFMLADGSLKVVRKLKDSNLRPLFVPSYDGGIALKFPDQIMGYPIQINQDVAAMAANAKSVLFGDFSFYKIRDAMQLLMFRFTDSAYAKLGQVGFLAWMRSGGTLVDAKAVSYYTNSAT
jgi:HK97 family phage major capsid protein